MTDPDPRAAFAAMTKALITDFRANGGQVTSGPFAGRPVLLLTTMGAKSGQARLAPLVYSRDGEHYVIVASKGGSPTRVVLAGSSRPVTRLLDRPGRGRPQWPRHKPDRAWRSPAWAEMLRCGLLDSL